MIKTNSELPITLLKKLNEKLNDFDLVLFHLYISEPKYKKYFDKMRENHPDRRMILDNSAYEFFIKGEELDLDKYEEAIKDLNPDYYILPDVLMDKDKTIENILKFRSTHQSSVENYFKEIEEPCPQPIAVVQGNTVSDFNYCLTLLLQLGYTNIALPFHNSFFKTDISISPTPDRVCDIFLNNGYDMNNDDVRYAYGRCEWLKWNGPRYLFLNGKPKFTMLHFLGSHCPIEKVYYNEFFNGIDNVSMDTGYPVKCAIEGIKLGEETSKPNTIIDDFMHNSFSKKQEKLIEDNINTFKNY